MSNLATMTKKITGIISLGHLDEFDYMGRDDIRELLLDYFSVSSDRFGFIFHDLDVNPNGDYKTLHIHFVADMRKRKRLSSFLNEISFTLKINPLAVTISKYTSFEASLQYLVHRNDPDKVQYPCYLINSNIPLEELKVIMQEDASALDLSKLYDVVSHASSRVEVLDSIGLYYYRLYRGVINDMWIELHPRIYERKTQ